MNPLTAPVSIYVPRDSAARSVGADEVADALTKAAERQGRSIRLVRNGSRGMLWLEPLVEVETTSGRIGYGPVAASDVDGLVAAGLFDGAELPQRVGVVDDLPWLATQNRVTFARMGVTDPLSPDDYLRYGGLVGLVRALENSPAEVVAEVTDSGLRGRGGAGFPAGIKWKTVLDCVDELKFVCCNADEGDSGTFADRMVMEGDPFTAHRGHDDRRLRGRAPARATSTSGPSTRTRSPPCAAPSTIAYAHGWLGDDVLGSALDLRPARAGRRRRLHLRRGDLDAREPRGQARRGAGEAADPGASTGLFGRPTVVNNVLTLGAVPMVLADGAQAYAATRRRALTRHPGVPARRQHQAGRHRGDGLRDHARRARGRLRRRHAVRAAGAGGAGGRPARRLPARRRRFDLPMDYEAFAEAGAMVGHGGVVVFDDTVDMAAHGPVRDGVLRERSRAASARRAGSGRCAAWR